MKEFDAGRIMNNDRWNIMRWSEYVDRRLAEPAQHLVDGVLGPLLEQSPVAGILEVFLQVVVHLYIFLQLSLSVLTVPVGFLQPRVQIINLFVPTGFKFVQGFPLSCLQSLDLIVQVVGELIHFLGVPLLFAG